MSDSSLTSIKQDMVTRCPQCSTSFRVTHAQLKTAKGAVRCGSCLRIFKAMDYLLTPANKPRPAPKSSAAATNAPKSGTSAAKPEGRLQFDQSAIDAMSAAEAMNAPEAETAAPAPKIDEETIEDTNPGIQLDADDDDDELLFSDDMDETGKNAPDATVPRSLDSDLSESFLELDTWEPEAKSLFEREVKEKEHNPNEAPGASHDDEAWALSLLQELEEEEPAAADQTADTAPPAPPAAPRNAEPSAPETPTKVMIPGTNAVDLHSDERAPSSDAAANRRVKSAAARKAPDPAKEPDFEAAEAMHADADQQALDDNNFDELFAEDRGREYLAYIQPEPVELAFGKNVRTWPRKLLWASLSLVACLGIVAQTAWFKFDYFSRVEPYRDWYALACPVLGCSLPTRVDRSKIRAYNLVVRSHPRTSQALMVDTILLNTAPFQQPFPDLVLTFANLEGEPLASRRFRPDEYLGGELAGRRLMPERQPVHLSLEVVDPGPAAVNYTASIPGT